MFLQVTAKNVGEVYLRQSVELARSWI